MRLYIRWTFTLMLIAAAARVGAYTTPYETWMGAFVGDKKVGYLSYRVDDVDVDGAKGYRIASVLDNRLMVLGVELNQLVTTVVYTDKSYVPIREDFSMSSGGKTTKISAQFKKESVECVISAGSGRSTQSIPIPKGASLVGDAMFAVNDPSPQIGQEYSLYYFNPLTLSVDSLKVKVEAKEKVKLGDKDYDTIVLQSGTPMGDMTIWQEPTGEVVKVKAIMGISLVRQSKDEAMAGIGNGAAGDFAVLTSIKPDHEIPSPRKVKELDIVLKGMGGFGKIESDSRQAVKQADGSDAVEFTIKARNVDLAKSVSVPVDTNAYADLLAATPYLDYDLREVTDQARQIVGNEKNTYKICSKIRAWVYQNMKTRADIGITRSASDVLKSKMGVCRDYAILFAALARSSGVPTKVAAGLTFTEGAFYYHAWDECFVGEWVPFDATLPTDFVDATHIKLAEGDATTMFGLAKVIGSLKAEVKGWK